MRFQIAAPRRFRMSAFALFGGIALSGACMAGTAAPTLSAGHILTSTVDVSKAPGAPAISITYAAPGNLGQIGMYFDSPSGQIYHVSFYSGQHVPNTGTIVVSGASEPMSRYAAPGTWTLYDIDLYDQSNKYTRYTGSNLAARFPSLTFTVVNTLSSDAAAPTVTSGKILTPSVSLASRKPALISVAVKDNLSGTGYLCFVAQSSNGGYVMGGNFTYSPILNGTLITQVNPSDSGAGPGTYTITDYDVCDLANNCVTGSQCDTGAGGATVNKVFANPTFVITK